MKNNFEFTEQELKAMRDILQVIRDGYKETSDTFVKKGNHDIAKTYDNTINNLERILEELNKYKE